MLCAVGVSAHRGTRTRVVFGAVQQAEEGGSNWEQVGAGGSRRKAEAAGGNNEGSPSKDSPKNDLRSSIVSGSSAVSVVARDSNTDLHRS